MHYGVGTATVVPVGDGMWPASLSAVYWHAAATAAEAQALGLSLDDELRCLVALRQRRDVTDGPPPTVHVVLPPLPEDAAADERRRRTEMLQRMAWGLGCVVQSSPQAPHIALEPVDLLPAIYRDQSYVLAVRQAAQQQHGYLTQPQRCLLMITATVLIYWQTRRRRYGYR